jgi:hypothetical protein
MKILPLLVALLAVAARAVDVSGTYENAGSMIGAPPGAGATSLQGLLGLNFDHELTRAIHSETSRVEIRQTDSQFGIVCRKDDGTVAWSGYWQRNVGYDWDRDKVSLLFRAPRFKEDGFLFKVSLVGDRRMLLVDVIRVNTTYFGPMGESLGTFIFDRVPDARVAAR